MKSYVNRADLAKRFVKAWSQKDLSAMLDLMHRHASYHDAFWGETCSGIDLEKYLATNLEEETSWYRIDGEPVPTCNGIIIRYTAFNQSDPEGTVPVYSGAEIFTYSGDLILTISDYYCAPSADELIAVAALAERQHCQSYVAKNGLGARTSSCIKQTLRDLVFNSTVYIDPAITVTKLADCVGCSVMHLFHVLEEEMDITFLVFVNQCRSRYASKLLMNTCDIDANIEQIAETSGFKDVSEFRHKFRNTFGMDPEKYINKFTKIAS